MPSFNPLGGITGRTSATLFEIRLENEFIVLRGAENEASDQILKGTVVLCLPSPLKVEDVHLKLTGLLKIGWNDQRTTPSGVSNNRVDKTSEILNYKWDPFVGLGPGSKAITLEAGNYEWPFQFTVSGTMFESVEGMPDFNMKYKLKATVARGKLAYDLHAYKAVRIVRTLDPAALELSHAMTVENIWPNKIEYQLIIPTKAIVFGTHIDVDMRFTSLLKGLEIGSIKCVLIEMHDLTLQSHSAVFERSYKHTRTIDSWEFHMTKDANYTEMMESGQDGWSLKEKLPLPKTLAKCLQNVEIPGINIRHKVKFNIALLNPDGHTSELRATLPVSIFISPNMPLNEDGCLMDQTPMSAQAIVDSVSHAPPLYGEHILDQLYEGIQSGLQTPHPQSGVNTPFYAQSRSGSSENVVSLDGAVDPNGPVHPDALMSRLHDLNSSHRNSSFIRRQLESGQNTPRIPLQHSYTDSGYFGTNHSAEHSTQLSRRVSEEDEPRGGLVTSMTSGQQTPEHIDYSEFGDLTKVPSYNTAVRAPVRGMSYTDAVPHYQAAVSSQPITPARTPGYTSPSGIASPTVGSLTSSPTSMRRNLPQLHTNDDDAHRRLHIMQNRGS